MPRLTLPFAAFLLCSLGGPGFAYNRSSRPVRPSVIIRVKDGPVDIRCRHPRVKSWRGTELHAGDTLRVGPGGWASVSIEATGARFFLKAGSEIQIESSGIRRISGPMPNRGFELPRRDPSKPPAPWERRDEDDSPSDKKPLFP